MPFLVSSKFNYKIDPGNRSLLPKLINFLNSIIAQVSTFITQLLTYVPLFRYVIKLSPPLISLFAHICRNFHIGVRRRCCSTNGSTVWKRGYGKNGGKMLNDKLCSRERLIIVFDYIQRAILRKDENIWLAPRKLIEMNFNFNGFSKVSRSYRIYIICVEYRFSNISLRRDPAFTKEAAFSLNNYVKHF